MSSESRFPEVSERLIGLVMAGLSLEAAARRVDTKPETLRRWLRLGRAEPEGTYGAFAAAIDDARKAVEVDDAPLTPEEFERLLARAVRRGSLSALKVWAGRHGSPSVPATPRVPEDPADEFADLDELAARRAARRA